MGRGRGSGLACVCLYFCICLFVFACVHRYANEYLCVGRSVFRQTHLMPLAAALYSNEQFVFFSYDRNARSYMDQFTARCSFCLLYILFLFFIFCLALHQGTCVMFTSQINLRFASVTSAPFRLHISISSFLIAQVKIREGRKGEGGG